MKGFDSELGGGGNGAKLPLISIGESVANALWPFPILCYHWSNWPIILLPFIGEDRATQSAGMVKPCLTRNTFSNDSKVVIAEVAGGLSVLQLRGCHGCPLKSDQEERNEKIHGFLTRRSRLMRRV